jgi:hypothetical protein
MAKLAANNQQDSAEILPICVFVYSVSRSEATGYYTVYLLMFGREAICPMYLMFKTP